MSLAVEDVAGRLEVACVMPIVGSAQGPQHIPVAKGVTWTCFACTFTETDVHVVARFGKRGPLRTPSYGSPSTFWMPEHPLRHPSPQYGPQDPAPEPKTSVDVPLGCRSPLLDSALSSSEAERRRDGDASYLGTTNLLTLRSEGLGSGKACLMPYASHKPPPSLPATAHATEAAPAQTPK